MNYTGLDPFTKQEIYVAKGLGGRKSQRALVQFFNPENHFIVREALLQAWRGDLIGGGCDYLIPTQPPKEALEARRRQANGTARGDHYNKVANLTKAEPASEHGLPKQRHRSGQQAVGRQEKEIRSRKLTLYRHSR